MSRRRFWIVSAVIALCAAGIGTWWALTVQGVGAPQVTAQLVRAHSPVIGAADATVTVVEFLDPSCEGCRAFHPFVKRLLTDYPAKVRVVIRYAPFHQGSDEAVAILEAAREQGRYEAVLDALYARQPEWAVHGAPDLALAWRVAVDAGLEFSPSIREAALAKMRKLLTIDVADLNALGVEKTPTFYVNGRPLARFHPDELRAQVERALGPTK